MSEASGHTSAPVAVKGGRPVFTQLYAAHHQAVYGYLRARTLDANDADDLCQEVFLRALDNLDRFDPKYEVRPWLMGIGRNVLLEHVRRGKRRKEVQWTELCLELEQLAGDENPYEDIIYLIPLCLGELGESAHNALKWHYMDGLKIEQIAGKLERTVGAVKVLMVRARQAVKRCVQTQRPGGASA